MVPGFVRINQFAEMANLTLGTMYLYPRTKALWLSGFGDADWGYEILEAFNRRLMGQKT